MSFNYAIPGAGCTLSYCTTSNGTFTNVGQLRSIDGPNVEVAMWDSTGLSSSSYEQVPTLLKAGDVSFTVVYDPANTTHAALTGYMTAKTLLYWKLTFASPLGPGATAPGSAKVDAFAGYVNGWSLTGFEDESGVEATFKIGATGDVTIG